MQALIYRQILFVSCFVTLCYLVLTDGLRTEPHCLCTFVNPNDDIVWWSLQSERVQFFKKGREETQLCPRGFLAIL